MGGQSDFGTYNATGLTGYPACRESPASWVDASGDFWIFGGSTLFNSSEVGMHSPLRFRNTRELLTGTQCS
jgi:hypothetical protein